MSSQPEQLRLDRHDWMALGGEIFADQHSALRLKLDGPVEANQFTQNELSVIRSELAKVTASAKIERTSEPTPEELIALARQRLRRLSVPEQMAA